MQERKTVTKAMALQYRRSGKKEKGVLLEQFTEATGYNRVYAARLLRGHGLRVEFTPGTVLEGSVRVKAKRTPRAPLYGPDVVHELKKIWKTMDYICGKRLAPAMGELVPCLVRHGELRASKAVREKLMQMSAATIDRLLEGERRKAKLKGRGQTKPGTLLKQQIPVRTFADWDDLKPGFMEIDLVAHNGGSSHGEHCQILDATDVSTGWSEQFAVPTKAQQWVFDGIRQIREHLPFALLGLDSDNGSEFINHQLMKYCTDEKLTFTRGRSGKKNDNCYVEQKNWSIVRRFSGYERYEGEEACRLLNELYGVVREYVNHFMPSMKLIEKVRDGGRVTKRYDQAQTPYARVLASPHISEDLKLRLRKRYAELNPAQLKRDIVRLQKKLLNHSIRLRNDTPIVQKPSESHPWRKSAGKAKTG
jgi:hypothetical protein